MRCGVARVAGVVMAVAFGFVLVGCGGSSTPDTEGQTLAQARQTLRDAGVSENNISVTGQTTGDDPNTLNRLRPRPGWGGPYAAGDAGGRRKLPRGGRGGRLR